VNGDYRLEYRWLRMRNCIVEFKAIEEIQFSYPLSYKKSIQKRLSSDKLKSL